MPASDPFIARYIQLLQSSPYIAAVAKPGRQIADIQYYAYNIRVGTDAIPLDADVPQAQTFDTHADSDFAVHMVSAAVQETAGGAFAYNDNVDLQVIELATGKRWYSEPTAIALVTGAGGFPFVLPAPRVWNPNTSISVQAINRDSLVNAGAGPVGLYIAFHGARIFYAG